MWELWPKSILNVNETCKEKVCIFLEVLEIFPIKICILFILKVLLFHKKLKLVILKFTCSSI